MSLTPQKQLSGRNTRTIARIVPILGGSYPIDPAIEVTILDPIAALGSVTLTLPTAPLDGEVHFVTSRFTISTLTIAPGTGKSVVGGPSTVGPTAPFALAYLASQSTWFRID